MPLMKYRISVTLEFLREMKHLSKRYKSLKEDLRNFGNDLLLNPEQGVSLGEAYEMYEKAPENIDVSFPVKFGVIADIKNVFQCKQ